MAADAARAAMWRLLFEAQIIQDGLKEYMIPEYMFHDGAREDEDVWVDISEFVEKRISGGAKYVSQFGPGWNKYKPHLSEAEVKQMRDTVLATIRMKDGRALEGFRYYAGLDRKIAGGVRKRFGKYLTGGTKNSDENWIAEPGAVLCEKAGRMEDLGCRFAAIILSFI